MKKQKERIKKKLYLIFILALFFSLNLFTPVKGISKQCSPKNTPAQQTIEDGQAIQSSPTTLDTTRFYYHEKYALIIVGLYKDKLHYQWFTNAARQQYAVLTETCGFNSSNIYILLTFRPEWADALQINRTLVNAPATEQNIAMTCNMLKTKVDDDDLLYTTVISHGGDTHHLSFSKISIDFWQGIIAHDTYFGLENITNSTSSAFKKDNILQRNKTYSYDARLFDYELQYYIKGINARRIIFILQPCFSGGFINDLSAKNRVICTASTEAQLATASFIEYFADGLNGSAQDTNSDGKISLAEVYEYTAGLVYQWIQDHPDEYKRRMEYPLLDDNGDKIGHRYQGWIGYNQTNPKKDGYIAARVYDLKYEEI